MDDGLIKPRALEPLHGEERLAGGTVLDFWRWALGDLRMNTARGILAEYLVARAIGDDARIRVEWGPYDAKGADGTLVEIKTAGYLQSWATARLSTPRWTFKSVKAQSVWSEEIGADVAVDPDKRVHVWVFALQTCDNPHDYDPLNMDQWEFRVIPHRQLLRSTQLSAGLSFFKRLEIEPVAYRKLAVEIREARQVNDGLASQA